METPNLRDLVPIPSVWERLGAVERRLHEATEADDPFLTKVSRHLLEAGGKRFRPLLAQVAGELGPSRDHRLVDAGAAVELIHLGSLYHDDVIDEAGTRRGTSSVNINWSNTVAILAGDFLMARASEVAATSLGQEGVVLLARTYAELCVGQLLELQLVDDLTHGPEDYYRVISGKTASLIRTSARLGAMASDAPPAVVEAASSWAWHVGMVFQLTDDALDLVATDGYLGKPAGSDIGEGVYTLAVLDALAGTEGDRVRRLLQDGHPFPPDTVAEVIEIATRTGAVDRTLAAADAEVERANRAIDGLPDGPTREVLASLGPYLMNRVDRARVAG